VRGKKDNERNKTVLNPVNQLGSKEANIETSSKYDKSYPRRVQELNN
jgi:hypothetical protein